MLATSMAMATIQWARTPPQMERFFMASVPRTTPAMRLPALSAAVLRKWIMQYGTSMTKTAP